MHNIGQYYFTSWYDPRLQQGGFHPKAASPEVTPGIATAMEIAGKYEFLPELRGQPVARHPIALRYLPYDERQAILLCSQSNGQDESVVGGQGRDQNYFIHALVASYATFEAVPPIFCWRSPAWTQRDSSTSTVLPTLPSLAAFARPTMLAEIWHLLADARHREWFYRLLAAVLMSEERARPIIIVAEVDEVALWIAAVTCALPPSYRAHLSFATFYHTPYAPFMITGVLPGTQLQYPDEYLTYFILNPGQNRCSDVEESPYARFAAAMMQPHHYDEQLLPLLALAQRRFPNYGKIDRRLEQVALFYRSISNDEPLDSLDDIIPIITASLQHQQTLRDWDESDGEMLALIHQRILEWLQSGKNTMQLHHAYRALWHTLAAHGLLPSSITSDIVAAISLHERGLAAAALAMVATWRHVLGEAQVIALLDATTNELPAHMMNGYFLKGDLAMLDGHLTLATAQDLQHYYAQLSSERYAVEAAQLLQRFFQPDIAREAHGAMILALYQQSYHDMFWQAYWAEFMPLLTHPERARQLADIVTFWFEDSVTILVQRPYAIQTFFLMLPEICDKNHKERGFRESIEALAHLAAPTKWFALIAPYLHRDRRGWR